MQDLFTSVFALEWLNCARFPRGDRASSGFRALLRVNFAAEELGDKVVVKAEGMEVGAAEDVGSCEHGWVTEEELVCVCLHMLVSFHMVEPWRRGQVL